MALHKPNNRRKCHYFNNGKECPYAEVGCMFVHDFSEECKHGSKCTRQLCQFQHLEKTCKVCELEFRSESGQKKFQCIECDQTVCTSCAKTTHISEEFFMCSLCL